MTNAEYIPLRECQDGAVYRLHSRNLSVGMYQEETRSFLGLRTKFNDTFLFPEEHWDVSTVKDVGRGIGTAKPIRRIGYIGPKLREEQYLLELLPEFVRYEECGAPMEHEGSVA